MSASKILAVALSLVLGLAAAPAAFAGDGHNRPAQHQKAGNGKHHGKHKGHGKKNHGKHKGKGGKGKGKGKRGNRG